MNNQGLKRFESTRILIRSMKPIQELFRHSPCNLERLNKHRRQSAFCKCRCVHTMLLCEARFAFAPSTPDRRHQNLETNATSKSLLVCKWGVGVGLGNETFRLSKKVSNELTKNVIFLFNAFL